MELGEKLRQARLEAGLSQRQLCGDIITRNMLSQIENGSAKPSYATLQALCARLGKPVSLFWEEAPSQNLQLLHTARQQPPEQALETLQGYLAPDPVLDDIYKQQKCRLLLALAETALQAGDADRAKSLLSQGEPLLTPDSKRQYLLLRYEAEPESAEALAAQLPDNTREQLLRAKSALKAEDPALCIACLQCADKKPADWFLLLADAKIQQKDYMAAIEVLLPLDDSQCYSRLEICYRELGDFEKAYRYACLQRI